MPKYVFHIETPWAGQGIHEVFEFDTEPSDKELEANWEALRDENFNGSWWRLDD